MSSSRRYHDDDNSNNPNSFDDLTKALADSFAVLADEVGALSDRKTILEHKLRFAHEQYQQLADKYAPGNTDIAHTLAALQVPPDPQINTPDRATFVPLPIRRPSGSKQQTAEAIRDGRKVSRLIARLRGWVPANSDMGDQSTIQSTINTMRSSQRTTSRTTLEQDFTVPGKVSKLDCPFQNPVETNKDSKLAHQDSANPLPSPGLHHVDDPICAAMYSETHSSAPPSVGGAAKCPIRFMDQHSPEEVAKYFETHKHEIPRSHEVCVKRYQRNEDDIRKLDAKYGNMVSMIQGLGAKHQPMLPVSDIEEPSEHNVDTTSNKRVENWAETIDDHGDGVHALAETTDEDERQGRFDRPLREIRVGESPSRPWGIAVPYIETPAIEPQEFARPVSPFVMPKDDAPSRDEKAPAKCPFSNGQKVTLPAIEEAETKDKPHAVKPEMVTAAGKCPFDPAMMAQLKKLEQPRPVMPSRSPPIELPKQTIAAEGGKVKAPPSFLQKEDISRMSNQSSPQIVFNGPVFIGYPPDQAMAFLQQWQKGA